MRLCMKRLYCIYCLLFWTYPSSLSWTFPHCSRVVLPSVLRLNSQSSSTTSTTTTATKQNTLSSPSIYNFPELYDVAFSFRDFQEEVSFLTEVHKKHALFNLKDTYPQSVLELAAGPARHSIEYINQRYLSSSMNNEANEQQYHSQQHCHVVALDTNEAMVKYGKSLYEKECSKLFNMKPPISLLNSFQYLHRDMTNFDISVENHFDTVWCLLGSSAHIHDNNKFEKMLLNVLKVLKKGGTFVMELAHPFDVFNVCNHNKNSGKNPKSKPTPPPPPHTHTIIIIHYSNSNLLLLLLLLLLLMFWCQLGI
jgi:SAM-dependent methyltransferase